MALTKGIFSLTDWCLRIGQERQELQLALHKLCHHHVRLLTLSLDMHTAMFLPAIPDRMKRLIMQLLLLLLSWTWGPRRVINK